MEENYLLVAARYVELNPVRAKLVDSPEAYKWSSAVAHSEGRDDKLVKVSPLLSLVGHWREFLSQAPSQDQLEVLRHHERTGRPLGEERFVAKIEKALGRILHRRKPGPKQKTLN
jgi:putative transposase